MPVIYLHADLWKAWVRKKERKVDFKIQDHNKMFTDKWFAISSNWSSILLGTLREGINNIRLGKAPCIYIKPRLSLIEHFSKSC